MVLTLGARLGPYEILSPLGAGGMGEVYRARDTKLNREVALKVLPDAFTREPERLARFKREAQVLGLAESPSHWSDLWVRGSCRSRIRSARRSKRPTSKRSSIAT